MSDNIEYTFQASQASDGDDFFDFAAASGEYDHAGPSNVAQTWATPDSPWKEGWDDFSMAPLSYDGSMEASLQTATTSVMGNSYPAGMGATPQHSYIPAPYDLDDELDTWDSEASLSALPATSANPLDHLHSDTLTDSFHGHGDQRPEGTMVGWAHSDGHQSE